jgi:hypothetical protein
MFKKKIKNKDMHEDNARDVVAAQWVKWASKHNHLPNEIRICHKRIYASGPNSDFEEKWWLEEKRSGEKDGGGEWDYT